VPAYSSKSKLGGKILQKIALIAGTALMIAFSAPTAWAAAQETETGIQKAKEQYTAAFNKGDAAKVAEMYTDTAYLMPPGSPTATGRAAIQKYWEAGIQAGVKNLALTPGKIDQFGEVAREIGNYSFETKDGTKVEGKWVGIWKPQSGSWKLDTDVWNSDK
jgi:ketosteroid isomerase-like protein